MKKQLNEFDVIAKRNHKINQKRLVLERKYSKMLWLRKEKLQLKQAKEIERYERKRKKLMDIELHNLTHKRQKKEPIDKTVWPLKQKALRAIQKYRKYKLSVRATDGARIFLVDKQVWVKLSRNVHWGHVYWQKNFCWLAFEEENIRPIHYITNKTQCDQVAEWKINLPKEIQEYLKTKSEDKSEKRATRDRKFYQGIIDHYEPLIEIEEKRLWITNNVK